VNVAVLGASNDPERYSYKAVIRLKEAGHKVFPVHPHEKAVAGIPVFASISDIKEPIDTVTLYVAPGVSDKLENAILNSGARRLIFNPGAENPALAAKAQAKGIRALDACTLTMLVTRQFDAA
jgi:uncharacterized protein